MKIRSPWLSLGRLPVTLLSCFSVLLVVTGCRDAIPGQPLPLPSVTISASPAQVVKGGTAMLSVAASDAMSVTVAGSDGSSYNLPADGGTQPVNPTTTTTYTATATGPGGTTSGNIDCHGDRRYSADRKYSGQSHVDCPGRLVDLDHHCDERHHGDSDGERWQFLHLVGNRRNTIRQSHSNNHLYRDRNWTWRYDHFNCNRHRECSDQPSANGHNRSQPNFRFGWRFLHTDCYCDECHIGRRHRE